MMHMGWLSFGGCFVLMFIKRGCLMEQSFDIMMGAYGSSTASCGKAKFEICFNFLVVNRGFSNHNQSCYGDQ